MVNIDYIVSTGNGPSLSDGNLESNNQDSGRGPSALGRMLEIPHGPSITHHWLRYMMINLPILVGHNPKFKG